MKKNIFLLVVLMNVLTSCFVLKLVRKNLDTEGQTNVFSKYNSDNKVFTDERLFTYDVRQELKDRTLSYKLSLLVIPGQMNRGTKIKYKYYYTAENLTLEEHEMYLDTIKFHRWEITSVNEDSSHIFVHPPRSYSLNILELSPFPQIKFPTDIGKTWSAKMFIGTGWGDLAGKTIKYNYIIDNVEYVQNDSSNYQATILGESFIDINDPPLCKARFEFDSFHGFTNMSYNFNDSTKIYFTLIQ